MKTVPLNMKPVPLVFELNSVYYQVKSWDFDGKAYILHLRPRTNDDQIIKKFAVSYSQTKKLKVEFEVIIDNYKIEENDFPPEPPENVTHHICL